MFLKTRHNPYNGFRSSCLEVFCEKDILKKLLKIHRKTTIVGSRFDKAEGRLKRDSSKGDFFMVLQNFQEHLFYGIPPVAASEACKKIRHVPL